MCGGCQLSQDNEAQSALDVNIAASSSLERPPPRHYRYRSAVPFQTALLEFCGVVDIDNIAHLDGCAF